MSEAKPFKISCYMRSESMRSNVGVADGAETKAEAFAKGLEWVAKQKLDSGYFQYAPDLEVGFVISDLSRK